MSYLQAPVTTRKQTTNYKITFTKNSRPIFRMQPESQLRLRDSNCTVICPIYFYCSPMKYLLIKIFIFLFYYSLLFY